MKCFSLSLTDLVDKWFEVGIAQKEPARLGNVTILKTHFFYPIGASFEAFKTWPWLGEENKSGIFMKWWKLQNTAWTSNSPPMSQDRLGLHRELVSLLITCISLAPAKGARLVAPGTEFSIYPQSRDSRRANYHRDTNPCYDSSRPGTWWQEGDVVSGLYRFPDVSAVTAHMAASSLHYVSGG